MKVLGINGSPRRGGNTELMIKEVFKVLDTEGIETEFFQLGGKQIHGCTACLKCRENPADKCYIKNDAINECITKMIEADAIILGSPVYFSDISTEIKALIDCSGYVLRGKMQLSRKVGAAVIAVRRTGAMRAFDSINDFFLINEMIIPGSSYWNVGIGKAPGDVLNDEEGMNTMKRLGENMAWVMKKINS